MREVSFILFCGKKYSSTASGTTPKVHPFDAPIINFTIHGLFSHLKPVFTFKTLMRNYTVFPLGACLNSQLKIGHQGCTFESLAEAGAASINYGCQHANCAKLLLSMLFARWQTFNIANVSGSTDNKDTGHRDERRRRWWAEAELRNCNCDIDNNAIK